MALKTARDGIDQLESYFAPLAKQLTAPLVDPPLRAALLARVLRAVDEGLRTLRSGAYDKILQTDVPEGRAARSVLLEVLIAELDHHDDEAIRWLLFAQGVALADFGAIDGSLESLVTTRIEEVVWLVAGAMWVEWASGQETTGMLRAALERLALADPSFRAKLTLAAGSATPEVREAAALAIDLLRDRSARLPRAP
jgi:hypothetical protein